MELYAVGQNGWGQLDLGDGKPSQDDVSQPIRIATGKEIGKPISTITCTIVKIDDRLCVAAGGPFSRDMTIRAALIVSKVNGDSICVTDGGKCLLVIDARMRPDPVELWFESPVQQVAAFDHGFVILQEDGTVSTAGDPRFPALLARPVTPEQPALAFGKVPDLDLPQDPVKHIAASGYTLAALTKSGAVYIWGQHAPSRPRETPFFPPLTSTPNYTDIGGGKDILDIALGETHAIALTCEGALYVIGSNRSGQLGIPALQWTNLWTPLAFSPPKGFRVTGVAAGPYTSFILVSSESAEEQKSELPTP